MLSTLPTAPGLLFGSFLYRRDLHQKSDLVQKWEDLLGKSFEFVPDHNPLASYYSAEMGDADLLERFFLVTAEPQNREELLRVKLLSLEWERSWSKDNKREVNVDIGILSAENFLLATTKNYSHRVYLGQDIFADLTYYFHEGELRCLPWTYPDYRDEQKMEFFTWLRQYLLTRLA